MFKHHERCARGKLSEGKKYCRSLLHKGKICCFYGFSVDFRSNLPVAGQKRTAQLWKETLIIMKLSKGFYKEVDS